jgi:hypothetical protein
MASNNKPIKSERNRSANFAVDDSELLAEICAKYVGIISCKETNKVNLSQKQKAWIGITNKFNAGSLSGKYRTKDELLNKYKNMKKKYKGDVAKQKREQKATGGGPFQGPSTSNVFGITEQEVVGIANAFDSNGDEILEEIHVYQEGSVVSICFILI